MNKTLDKELEEITKLVHALIDFFQCKVTCGAQAMNVLHMAYITLVKSNPSLINWAISQTEVQLQALQLIARQHTKPATTH